MSLVNKVALITGSTSGIGRATAITLANNGARVVVTGIDAEAGNQVACEISKAHGNAVFIESDLLKETAPEQLVSQTVDYFGRLDIVVNCAAMICNKPIDKVQPVDWDQLFAVNLKAPFFIIQAALPWLRKSNGVVVNVSSINAIHNDYQNLVYDSLKAALNHMTQGLCIDLHKDGVRCNVVMPGGTNTGLLNKWVHTRMADPVVAEQTMKSLTENSTRIADSQDIANIVAFLVSDNASWINGALVAADNGVHLLR